jgi:hypothetical protein
MAEKNKIYTAADFERYHSGTMPANEMYELEKAALEDPFLADALEGYAYTSSFKNDVAGLKERLNEKRKKKKGFSISLFAQSGWWRIAALLIIIMGAGYFFYRLNYKEKENILAKNVMKPSIEKMDTITLLKNDSIKTNNNVAFEFHQSSNLEEKKKNVLSPIKSKAEKETFAIDKNRMMSTLSVAERSNQSSSDSIKFNMKSGKIDKNPSLQYLLKGKVTDINGKPLAFATVKNKSEDEATLTDTAGRFLLPSADSNTTAIVSVIGYETKKVTLQKDKEPVVAMNKSSGALEEVVVTGYGEKKKLKDTTSVSQELNSKVSGMEIKNQPISTLSNSEKFNEYLKENLQPVYDENNEQFTGEVLLSFTINKKGRPRNIKVVKSSCKDCETEAIKLLENGPRWTIEKEKRKTVLIKF